MLWSFTMLTPQQAPIRLARYRGESKPNRIAAATSRPLLGQLARSGIGDLARGRRIVSGSDQRGEAAAACAVVRRLLRERADAPPPRECQGGFPRVVRQFGRYRGSFLGLDPCVAQRGGNPAWSQSATFERARSVASVKRVIDIAELRGSRDQRIHIGIDVAGPSILAQLTAEIGTEPRPRRRVSGNIGKRESLQRGGVERKPVAI